MSAPELGAPAWHPDPTGRHQFRWFDGNTFTDQVADGGVVAVDSMHTSAAVGAPPQPGPSDPQPPAGEPATQATQRSRRRWPLLVGAVAVLALAGAAIVVTTRDDDDGTGAFQGRAAGDELGIHAVSVPAGHALAVEVEPGDDLDAVIVAVVDEDDADRIAELYEEFGIAEPTSLDEAFPEADRDALEGFDDADKAVLRTDVGFAGDDEVLLVPVSFDVDIRVVVGPFDDGADDYEITIEIVDLDVGDDPDGEELLEAAADADELDGDLRALAREVLDR